MKHVGWVAIALAATLAGCAGGEGRPAPTVSAAQSEAATVPKGAVDVLVTQGEAALAQGLYDEAGANFHRAADLDPRHVAAKLGVAEVSLALGRPSEALSGYEAAMVDPALKARAYQGRGVALLALGKRDGACPDLAEAVRLDSRLWRAWNGLGRCSDLSEDWSGAETAYRNALKLQPSAALVRNNYGFSLFLQGRYRESAAELQMALRLDPTLAVARTNLRLALAAQGQYSEATLDAGPDEVAQALNNAGFVAMLRGDYPQAEQLFARAMEASPSFNEATWRNLNHLNRMVRGEEPGKRQ
jgi:Flp pilus assembly protein TadD